MSKKSGYFSAIKFLSQYIRQYKKHFLMFYFGWFVDSLLSILIPIFFGKMIDEIVYNQDLLFFLRIAFLFILCIVFSGGLYFLLYAQHGYLMNMFVFSIRKDIFEHLQKCEAQYLTNISSGEMLALLQKYPEECMHFVIRNMIHTLNGIILIFTYAFYLLSLNWKIGIVALATALLTTFLNTRFKGKIRKLGAQKSKYYGENVSWIYEMISALRDIRLLCAKEQAEETFCNHQKNLLNSEKKIGAVTLTTETILSFTKLIMKLLLYAITAFGAVNGTMTLGMLTVVFSFYERMAEKISAVSTSYLDAQGRVAYIRNIESFLRTPVEKEGKNKLKIHSGEVLFQNVSFGYEKEKYIMNQFNLKIAAGEKLALVGRSGCGKTTLAYLLIGFYCPQSGEILVDGQKIAECKPESVRHEIGIVQQDVLVFQGTIRQNLLMGNPHANEAQLLDACEAAGLGEYVRSLKMGIDTVIGGNGIELSGGQKQRVAIARIILKNPQIVILDEATAALDQETEEVIHQVWKKAFQNKTVIMIAHRQSSVMLCEQVVILENGRVVERGIPKIMVKSSKRFQQLFAIKEEMEND